MGNRAARRIRLTDASAIRFKPEESEYTIWDTKTPGLGVRIKPSGYRAWVYHESTSGRPRRHSLGPVSLMAVKEARQACLGLQVRQEGDKPADVPAEANIPGFREFVAGEWKAARYDKMKPSTRKGIDSALKTQLLPKFGKLPLNRITRSRIIRWFDGYSRSSPGGANQALDKLSGILNHAIVCGHITVNPTRDIRRNPIAQRPSACAWGDLNTRRLSWSGIIVCFIPFLITGCSLPVAIPYFADHPDNGMIRRFLQLPDQFREQAGAPADDLLEIPRDLARERQHQVGVLAEFTRQTDNGSLRGRRHVAALDLAHVGRLDADSPGDLPQGIAPVVHANALTPVADGIAKLCHIYYIIHTLKHVKQP